MAGASFGLSPLPPAPNAGTLTATSPAKERETVWSMVAFSEAPKTVKRDTTATPVINAVAVAAVRLGPRSALRLARLPETPRSRSSGRPRIRTAYEDATGPSTTKATRASTAPAALSQIGPLATTPVRMRPVPARATPVPAYARVREAAEWSTAVSRSAASGAVRPARTAGSSAEPRQTITPTASGSSIETPLITRLPSGKGNPMSGKSVCSPAATPMPPSSPATDAARATTTASMSVEETTWRREAPSARSSAFSQVRWAITIAKVLWIEKVATSSTMPEKTSSSVVKRFRN